MTNTNINLLNALPVNDLINEAIRIEVEKTINLLLQEDLTDFLCYEKHSVEGYNTGNSRNGYYERSVNTTRGPITVKIPRDRNGEFKNRILEPYNRTHSDLEAMIIHLYRKGITTQDIADLIEKMYGCYYTRQTISNITSKLQEQVEAFHQRQLEEEYLVVYCDATYLSVRRDTVQKEALHVLIGITKAGKKEVIDYALFPTESISAYESLLTSMKERGVRKVHLFVSDGFKGLGEICQNIFPTSLYQRCWVHISRNVKGCVRKQDIKDVLDDLKPIYSSTTEEAATSALVSFLETWAGKYPRLQGMLSDVTNLFTFLQFPESIQRSLYSTNIIENFNKHLKRYTNQKEQFPTEDSLDRFVYARVSEYNSRHLERIHRGFAHLFSSL